jgi:NAD(P)-dependent dehydrogenase (short-subunit alcohol dehydrogenase family)
LSTEGDGVTLDGRVAIVTGSGHGLGTTYARALAAEGAAVVVADLDGDAARQVAGELTANGARAIGVRVDTSDEDTVGAMAREAESAFGGIDILVNNAGWRPLPAAHHYDDFPEVLTSKEWMRVLAVNVVGPLICARACRPSMAARGGGVVVNQSSNAAYEASAGAYGVSKLALNGLTMSLAEELVGDGIRVNGIAPGVMTGRGDPSVLEPVIARQVIKRRGTPDDLVGALLFLCSDAASFITGQTILVDGGQTRRI